jgi:branched-chain amino acid transport system substrate-binding protein
MRRTKLIAIVFVFVGLLVNGSLLSSAMAEENIIKIGFMGPLKFGVAKSALVGAQMAVDEINAGKGIVIGSKKHRLVLVSADSNEYLSTTDAVSAIQKLIHVEKVDMLLGGFKSEAALAQQEVMAENKIIFISLQTGALELCERLAKNYDKYKYFFRFGGVNSFYMGLLGVAYCDQIKKALKDQLGIEKPRVAIQFEKALWADGLVEVAEKRLPKMGFEIVRVGRHSMMADDLTSEVSAIRAAKAHLVYSGGAGPASHVLAKQLGELMIPAAQVSMSSPASEKQHWQATGGYCDGEYVLSAIGRVKITSKTIPFWDKFVELAKDHPSVGGGGAAYDAIFALKDAIERVKTLDTDKVVSQLEKTNFVGALGSWGFYPRDHKWPHDCMWGSKNITWTGSQWQNGEFVTVWPDGGAVLGDESWKDVRFEGTKDYKIPAVVKDYWKDKN